MNPTGYTELYKLEGLYWWFVARQKLLKQILDQILPRRERALLLDVGCGTGFNFSVLSAFGKSFGSDASEVAFRFSQSRGVARLIRSRIETLPFSSASFDLVTTLNVLENVDDDLEAMMELRRIIKEDGLLLITVPAYGFLWSQHDEALHHRRRYTAYELRN